MASPRVPVHALPAPPAAPAIAVPSADLAIDSQMARGKITADARRSKVEKIDQHRG